MGKVEDLLVEKGLYDSVEISIADLDEFEHNRSDLISSSHTIDCYCIICKTNRIFKSESFQFYDNFGEISLNHELLPVQRIPSQEEKFNWFLNTRCVSTYKCTKDHNHFIYFDLITTKDRIIKIGQYPSVADLLTPEIAKYKSVLGKQYVELSKALGLFAHGIGIGSYVYLRRIIESLLLSKYNNFSSELKISLEQFGKLRFDDKIDLLKDHLPMVLVENKNIYGIVSKGIHELSEDECISLFPMIKIGIELILDDLLSEKERAEKEKMFSSFVAQKSGEL